MSDEALNAHLDMLDAFEKEQGDNYETWLEDKVAKLEAENKALREKAKREMLRAIVAEVDLSKPPTERTYCEGCALPSENAVLIKRLWDYEHQASDERIRDEK